jgi:RNA polymerase sigma-70 factor (ECF subfamily)
MTSDVQQERDDVQQILVACAQAYLRRCLQETAPGAILTLFWEEFYRFYATLIVRMVRRRVPDGPDQDDLIQEVWLTVTRKLPEFNWNENRSGFRAWFAKVVHDKAVDLVRRRCRQRVTTLDCCPAEPQDTADGAGPAEAFERGWQEDVVHTALADLRPAVGEQNYQILRLHFWDNLPAGEVAAAVGLTPEEVSARQYRLLKKLRARILAYCGRDFTPVL